MDFSKKMRFPLYIPQSLRYRTNHMSKRRTNPEYLNGVPELLILKLLSTRSMHGYDLVEAIKQATQGALSFGEGCIYPMLHLLESKGVLSSKKVQVRARARVVYSLTAKGKKRLGESVTRWKQVVNAVNSVLGTDHGEPIVV
jgi:PadR family transcriptional regulator, regulatory protein PadR